MAAKKETTQAPETSETSKTVTRDSGIKVNSPFDARPKVLPLIVILPEDASKAQIERAKVLNGYAYQFPDKWEKEKEKHLKDLEDLKDAPDPVEEGDVKLFVGGRIPN
jgi:hypothetical protein